MQRTWGIKSKGVQQPAEGERRALCAEFTSFWIVHCASLAEVEERALEGCGVDDEDVVRDLWGGVLVSEGMWGWGRTDPCALEPLDVGADAVPHEDEDVGCGFCIRAY